MTGITDAVVNAREAPKCQLECRHRLGTAVTDYPRKDKATVFRAASQTRPIPADVRAKLVGEVSRGADRLALDHVGWERRWQSFSSLISPSRPVLQ